MLNHFSFTGSVARNRHARQLFTFSCTVFLWLPVSEALADAPQLILPASVVKGSGTLTNAGKITFAGAVSSNIVFSLQSSDPARLSAPGIVTVPAGGSNAAFNLVVGENFIADGDRQVTLTATNPAFSSAVAVVTVLDDDPDHIVFSAVTPIVDTNTGNGLTMTAVKADGTRQTNFNRSLTFFAQGIEGILPLVTTNVVLQQGQRYAGFQVLAPGHAVRICTVEYPGQSDPFTVIPPAFYAVAQPVADAAWHSASSTLLASVPATGGVYSNCLVAIDTATGLVTNSYPVGFNPGTIEMSPDGNYLYVALSNATLLQRFDMNTRQAGIMFSLGTNSNPVRIEYDFCIPPGMTDSVVVEARDSGNGSVSRAGIFRYDSGVPTLLPNFYNGGSSGWMLTSLSNGSDVALSPNLVRGSAATGAILATATNFAGTMTTFLGGQLFDNCGYFYETNSMGMLGNYPNVLDQINYTSLPQLNPDMRRVFYLSGYANYGTTFYNLKVYDRDFRQELLQLAVPGTPGSPSRFVRCGTNALVYVAGNQLWFIGPDAVQPPGPAADLALSVSALPPVAIVGSGYTFTLSLSNAGPGLASIVRVTNALPSNAIVAGTTASSGSVALAGSAFTWTVGNLPAGSNATLQVTLNFNTGGWQTNTTWALGFECDPVASNNVVTIPVYVQLPPAAFGVFPVNYSSQDLFYDPARDRLVLSAGAGLVAGQTNGMAVFNPYTGITESFTSITNQPGNLAPTDDGEYVYVSLPQDGLVRRLNLDNFSKNLEFAVGSSAGVLGWMTNTVMAGASSLPDPIPFNNEATQSLYVMPLMMAGVNFAYDQNMGSNVLQFAIQGGWGSSYALETSTDLSHWTNLLTFPCQPGSQTVEAPFDPCAPATFYRLRFATNQAGPP